MPGWAASHRGPPAVCPPAPEGARCLTAQPERIGSSKVILGALAAAALHPSLLVRVTWAVQVTIFVDLRSHRSRNGVHEEPSFGGSGLGLACN